MNLIDMNKEEMDKIKSGCVWSYDNSCQCACAYANSGGSSAFVNYTANIEGGKVSPQCARKAE